MKLERCLRLVWHWHGNLDLSSIQINILGLLLDERHSLTDTLVIDNALECRLLLATATHRMLAKDGNILLFYGGFHFLALNGHGSRIRSVWRRLLHRATSAHALLLAWLETRHLGFKIG